jgi:DNA-binding transcriptional MerR regulator
MYIEAVSVSPESLRIGEFARRVGVSAELLRAWERRYGLLEPVRSPGGFRLYTTEDAERVARMRRGLDQGLSAAEAARAALQSARPSDGLIEDAASRLLAAIHDYDEAAVHAVLDQSFAAFSLETILSDLIIPTLTRVGLEWQEGNLAVSQEHFASNLIRARLLSLARMWGRGSGPLALLACAPGEQHDITLLSFGLVLRSYGWRILFLGANTPIATLTEAAETTRPALTVLASFDPDLLATEASALRRLAKRVPLVLSGPGATDALCAQLGIQRLDGDLVRAATELGHTTYDSTHAAWRVPQGSAPAPQV